MENSRSVSLTTTASYGRVTRVKTTTKEYLNGKLIKETVVETDYEKEDSSRWIPSVPYYPTYPTYPQPYITYTTSSAKLPPGTNSNH